jgi:hypothetical protein
MMGMSRATGGKSKNRRISRSESKKATGHRAGKCLVHPDDRRRPPPGILCKGREWFGPGSRAGCRPTSHFKINHFEKLRVQLSESLIAEKAMSNDEHEKISHGFTE